LPAHPQKVPESTQTETEAKTINGVDKGTTTDSVENAEEWTGFEDEEVSESQVSEKAQVLKDKAKKKKEKLKKLKKNKDSKKAAEQKAITSNSFAAIAEGQDDEGMVLYSSHPILKTEDTDFIKTLTINYLYGMNSNSQILQNEH